MQLAEEILAFIRKGEGEFAELAKAVFAYQYQECQIHERLPLRQLALLATFEYYSEFYLNYDNNPHRFDIPDIGRQRLPSQALQIRPHPYV